MKTLSLLLAIVLITSSAFADQRVIGHMMPLEAELLSAPVTLDCGLTIRELRGGNPDIAKLNSLCTHAMSNFFRFVKSRGLHIKHTNKFSWDASLIPTNTKYRSMNDESFRFRSRFVTGGNLLGYTDYDAKYMFSMSDSRDKEFNTTFVHELFHSMSMYYGVYENHNGSLSEKTNVDEGLAQDFTQRLGYGR